jgi:uncharacterized coiled-coil protein SlyX
VSPLPLRVYLYLGGALLLVGLFACLAYQRNTIQKLRKDVAIQSMRGDVLESQLRAVKALGEAQERSFREAQEKAAVVARKGSEATQRALATPENAASRQWVMDQVGGLQW